MAEPTQPRLLVGWTPPGEILINESDGAAVLAPLAAVHMNSLVLAFLVLFQVSSDDPATLYRMGLEQRNNGQLQKASDYFEQCWKAPADERRFKFQCALEFAATLAELSRVGTAANPARVEEAFEFAKKSDDVHEVFLATNNLA